MRAHPNETLRKESPEKRHIFVALAADYGNLGDLAITHAQTQYLRARFPDAVVEPIPISITLAAVKGLLDQMRENDIITLVGGGNTSDIYDDIQWMRELYLRKFPEICVIGFPQSIDFSNSMYGRWAAGRARRVYQAHRRLGVILRDSRSREKATRIFPQVKMALAPDVVLTLEWPEAHLPRDGVLLALRSDVEGDLGADASRDVRDWAVMHGDVADADTHIGDLRLAPEQAEEALQECWRRWASARLVITDRLHGMIFAVLTGTPCLVFDSKTGKVANFYRDWLRGIDWISFVSPRDFQSEGERLLRQSDALHVASLASLCRDLIDDPVLRWLDSTL